MKILYIGDVMAEPGMRIVERVLPTLRHEKHIDVVIAQAENVSEGKGFNVADYQRLRKSGVDGFTGGNHSFRQASILQLLSDPNVPVVAPLNMGETPNPGYKYVQVGDKRVLIASVLGQVVGVDAQKEVQNPLQAIDTLLESQADIPRDATVINIHGDYSSEKVVFGHYLDGRVSVVVGDHWHIPTADARVLPGGTAHQTDVGMCGTLDSSLGVTYESIIPRWRDGRQTRNVLATDPPYQFNALLVTINDQGLAESVEPIHQIFKD